MSDSKRLRYLACGKTHHNLRQMFSGAPRTIREFPSGVFLYFHPDGRRVLFDTGYAPSPSSVADSQGMRTLADAGFKGLAYSKLLPPVVADSDTVDHQLREIGVDPRTITDVVLSHLHPDHIGGVQFFPQARFVISQAMATTLVQSRVTEGVFTQLLPEWFGVNLLILDESALSSAQCGSISGYDLIGDGTFIITELPGHARGHQGALVEGKVLLAGDAAWGRDLIPRMAEMKPVPRLIQHDATQYVETARRLLDLEREGMTVLLSHDRFAQDSWL